MPPRTVAIGILGVGLIGKEVLKQLLAQAEYLQQQLQVEPAVVAVCNSRKMLLSSTPLQGSDWQAALIGEAGEAADPQRLAAHVAAHPGAAARVLLDCTASPSLADSYAAWMADLGLHIVTPNKHAGSGPLARYQQLRRLQRDADPPVHWMVEATVGAGLPVISTLRNLVETGDTLLRVEGVLSGTLSFLFNALRPGVAFSRVVGEARAAGFTEPDPREDLSGADVARKVVILARECGLQLGGLADLQVTSLVPPLLADLPSVDAFMQQLPQYDGDMAAKLEAASASGEVLRYVGCVDVAAGTASVSMAQYPASHPFAQLRGSENMVVFTTARYGPDTPLVVRGPGAGAAVTAAGVFGDLLAVMRYSAGART